MKLVVPTVNKLFASKLYSCVLFNNKEKKEVRKKMYNAMNCEYLCLMHAIIYLSTTRNLFFFSIVVKNFFIF